MLGSPYVKNGGATIFQDIGYKGKCEGEETRIPAILNPNGEIRLNLAFETWLAVVM